MKNSINNIVKVLGCICLPAILVGVPFLWGLAIGFDWYFGAGCILGILSVFEFIVLGIVIATNIINE